MVGYMKDWKLKFFSDIQHEFQDSGYGKTKYILEQIREVCGRLVIYYVLYVHQTLLDVM